MTSLTSVSFLLSATLLLASCGPAQAQNRPTGGASDLAAEAAAAPRSDEIVPNSIGVVIVDFDDGAASTEYASETLTDMFQYVKNRFFAMSRGQLDFNIDLDADGQLDVIAKLKIRASVERCERHVWHPQIMEQLLADPTLRSERYQTLVMMIPRATNCSWMGLVADLDCRPGRCISYMHGPYRGILLHEIGHTLGLDHAALDLNDDGVVENNTGDPTCPMGVSSGDKHINAPHFIQLGWHEPFPGMVREVSASGRYRLSPLHVDPVQAENPQILLVRREDGQLYSLSYRVKKGLDAGLSSAVTTGVSINSTNDQKRSTNYLGTLSDLESRQIGPAIVRQSSHDEAGVAFEIEFAGR